jgi:methionyl-tRNA formyltransferase
VDGTLTFTPQDEARASVWPGRTPEDGRIQSAMRVADVERLVRATTHPYPGAFVDGAGGRLRIWRGRIGDPHQPPAPGHRRIALADGVYDAVEFEPKA